LKKVILWIVVALVVVAGGIQFVRPAIIDNNPPVVSEPTWVNPEAKALAQRACFDCHSNETVWPWYSHIAPVSWLVARDVKEGRSRMNFSNWNTGRQPRGGELSEVLLQGEMPPAPYLLMHPLARLSETEKQILVTEFNAFQ
jgi:hypothetical protein